MKTIFIDGLFSTLSVFLAMAVIPLIFDNDFFKPFIQSLEDLNITDVSYSRIREESVVKADTNIVIVDIEDLTNAGLALLISKLNEYNPKVIGVDILLKKEDNELDNLYLADALSQVRNLVLSFVLKKCDKGNNCRDLNSSDSLFLCKNDDPLTDSIANKCSSGYSNLLINRDKKHRTVREFHPYMSLNGRNVEAFSTEIVNLYDKNLVKDLAKRNNEKEIIAYRGDFKKFHFLEGMNVVDEDIDLSFVENKIVLLGIVGAFRGYELLNELYFTPVNPRYVGRTFPDMTEVEIHANIISMILHKEYCDVMPQWVSILIAFILCYANMVIFSYICIINSQWYELGSLLIFVVESLIILFSTVIIFNRFNYQVRLTEALFAIAISVFAYQIYNETLKPMAFKTYKKFLMR